MPAKAVFTEKSTLRHVVVMSLTSAVGLMSIFIVDLVDILFLSMLDEKEIIAAVGFASSIMFFMISLALAVSIAGVALVSRAIGQGERELAKRRATNILVFGALLSLTIIWLLSPNIDSMLSFLGATGRTLELGTSYLNIILLGLPAVMISIIGSGLMRAVGDAKRAMYATAITGLVNAVLDPIFIFTFGLELEGAAVASLIARFSSLIIAYHSLVRTHNLLGNFDWLYLYQDLRSLLKIILPTMLANISSPLANAIVTEHISKFGDDAVAAYAIIGRMIPVMFAGLFALSSAIGPIIGQNYGAANFARIQQTIRSAILYSFIYSVLVCWGLYNAKHWLVDLFNTTDQTAEIIYFFSTYIAFCFFFQSLLFIAIAVFNNLGSPKTSAWLNFGRATLGTWPLILVFGWLFEAQGVFIGQAIGSIIFGCLGLSLSKQYIVKIRS